LKTLEQALDLAGPEGYVRTFVDYGPPMQQLLKQAAAYRIAPGYVARLLTVFSEEELPSRASVPQPLIEPLTEREMAILRLMAAGLSHREIAEELYLSVNTIKWHSTHIYSKLGVHKRADAVDLAQKSGIL
jgi:LuxR family maltose regulon positive regulatory protein